LALPNSHRGMMQAMGVNPDSPEATMEYAIKISMLDL
jgi:hypothetical protein